MLSCHCELSVSASLEYIPKTNHLVQVEYHRCNHLFVLQVHCVKSHWSSSLQVSILARTDIVQAQDILSTFVKDKYLCEVLWKSATLNFTQDNEVKATE